MSSSCSSFCARLSTVSVALTPIVGSLMESESDDVGVPEPAMSALATMAGEAGTSGWSLFCLRFLRLMEVDAAKDS